MSRLAVVAVALGLSNLAAAIGIGMSGVDGRVRLRVGLVFGAFEAAAPAVGLILGRGAAQTVGAGGRYLGGGLLIAVGGWALVRTRTGRPADAPTRLRPGPLIVTGAALSVDNLVVGFALGTQDVSVGVAAAVIASVSVVMALAGLELGHRLGGLIGQRSEEISGAVLVVVGIAIVSGVF